MEYDKDMVDEMTLALMHLVSFIDKPGIRAWKGFDLDTLDHAMRSMMSRLKLTVNEAKTHLCRVTPVYDAAGNMTSGPKAGTGVGLHYSRLRHPSDGTPETYTRKSPENSTPAGQTAKVGLNSPHFCPDNGEKHTPSPPPVSIGINSTENALLACI